MTYPSGRVITTNPDGANRPFQLLGSSKTYVTGPTGQSGQPANQYGIAYAADGAISQMEFGNNLWRTMTYNPLLQLKEMTDTGGGYTLLDNKLNWTTGNNNGNLPGQTVTQNGPGLALTFSPTYAYDTLNRLTSATEGSNWSQSFGYDRYGNMWLSGSTGSLPTQVLMPGSQSAYNAVNNRLMAQTYDAAGNQTSYSTYSSTYDAENRQTQVYDNASGSTFTYAYDGVGQRVSKTVEGVTTQYVHDTFGNLTAEYSTAGPQDVQCKTCYLSWDQLGSTRLVTDSSANVIARHDYLPFGQEIPGGDAGRTSQWDADDSVNQKFTGQDHDVETALDFFQARYHANQQGRFMSPDPGQAGADPGNPQSWNGYTYVLGNPIVYVDPSGMDPGDCEDDPSCGWWNPFPPPFPGPPDQQQPPPPPPPPPAVSTGGLNTPNSGVYNNGWPNGETNGLPPGVSVPGPFGAGNSPFITPLCPLPTPACVDTPPSAWPAILRAATSPWALIIALLIDPPVDQHSEIAFMTVNSNWGYWRRKVREFYASHLTEDEIKDCDEQWRAAIQTCVEENSKASPTMSVTGRHTDIIQCAKGHVSQHCGGNWY